MNPAHIQSAKTPALQFAESITLRPVELDDAEIYLRMVAENYDRLSPWHSASMPSRRVDERRKAMAADLKQGDDGQGHWWLIYSGEELAGTIALHHVHARNRTAFVGYWLSKEFEGKGLMTKSLETVLSWSFSDLGLLRVEIECAVNNVRSCAVPERLGIQRESIRRQSQVRNDTPLDMAIYAALADTWPPKPAERALPPTEIRVDDEILLRNHIDSDVAAQWDAIDMARGYLEEFLPWVDLYPNEEEHERLFNKRRWERDNFDGSRGYAIEYKGEFVGATGFGVPNRDNGIEIGYWLRQDMQGHGIMTRCVEAMVSMLFTEVGIRRITIRAATKNLTSRGIPERLGFKHEGTLRDAAFLKGEYLDLEVYSMIDHEWSSRSSKA